MNDVDHIPPFPEDVPTHPLPVIDFEKLKNGDKSEKDNLWNACTTLGFFYLKSYDVDAQPMWEIGAATMALPLEEKLKFRPKNNDRFLGYKAAGEIVTDAAGNVDSSEFMSILKDDALAWPKVVHGEYPSTVTSRMSIIKKFVQDADAVLRILLDILSGYLGSIDALRDQHILESPSANECRIIRNPPKRITGDKVALKAHRDFSSITLLHHKDMLGGLQILNSTTNEWQYIKPLHGHAICNVGSILSILSGGILRSGIHRVVLAPGEQGNYVRWSLIYFLRPHGSAIVKPLAGLPLIASKMQTDDKDSLTGVTADEWIKRGVIDVKGH